MIHALMEFVLPLGGLAVLIGGAIAGIWFLITRNPN